MKIIKQGRKPNENLRGKCRKCGCIFECGQGEAKWLDEDRPGAGDGCYTCSCPTCCEIVCLKKIDEDDCFGPNGEH